MAKNDKTNVMRILEQKKIPYVHYTYEQDASKSCFRLPAMCMAAVLR